MGGATRHKRFTGKLICTAVWGAHVHAGTSERADSRTLVFLQKQPHPAGLGSVGEPENNATPLALRLSVASLGRRAEIVWMSCSKLGSEPVAVVACERVTVARQPQTPSNVPVCSSSTCCLPAELLLKPACERVSAVSFLLVSTATGCTTT